MDFFYLHETDRTPLEFLCSGPRLEAVILRACCCWKLPLGGSDKIPWHH